MGSLKKFDGSSWINSNLRKLTTDTDTFTTFPAIIYAEGTNATVGLKGNTVQSSTPTPDSPVMPQGTGERTGNLWAGDVPRYSYGKDYKKYNPDNAVYIKAGTYTISSDGKLPNFQVFDDNHTQYSISEIMTFPSEYYYSVWDGLSISPISAEFHTATITILADCIITLTVVDNIGTYIMLNTGSTPLPYEPYGYKIPISSANTTTPVYLGEVQTTRKIKKLILTGTENIKSGTGFLYVVANDAASYLTTAKCICTHYPQEGTESCINTTNQIRFYVNSDVDTFKAYLAAQYANGTPVCVWYILKNEETAVVNEPLMRIGDYTDTVSGISIPVTTGGDTLSVGTTVQPSEVTANYYGWHTITVHERESGQWD